MSMKMVNTQRNSNQVDTDRGLTIDQLRKLDSSNVYVMNLMPKRSRDKQGSIISVTVQRAGSQPMLLLVPSTWIPIDLANQIPKSQLLESPEFLSIITRRMVKVLHPEEAETIMEDEDAQIELQRITDQINGANVELTDDDISSVSETADPVELQKQAAQRLTALPKVDAPERTPQELAAERVHPQVAAVCARDDLNPRDVQSQLRVIGSALTKGDFEYLSVNLPTSARDSKLMAYISEQIRTSSSKDQNFDNDVK